MGILIIITGISSAGKTTLGNKIKNETKLHLLSLDTYKVDAYEKYGFKNNEEKQILRNMAICQMKGDMILLMREGKSLIIEYPFDNTWQIFFDYIVKEYNYKSVIINCNSRPFEDIWNSRANRDNNFNIRPKCLTAKAYIKDKLYQSSDKINDNYKQLKYQEYINNKYTSLKGDYIFNETNYEQELKKIITYFI